MSEKILLTVSDEMLAAIDNASRKVHRSAWIRSVLAEKLHLNEKPLERGRPPKTGVENRKRRRDT